MQLAQFALLYDNKGTRLVFWAVLKEVVFLLNVLIIVLTVTLFGFQI